MDDSMIIELFFERNETAIRETQNKYGGYLTKIAYNVLHDTQDSKECVNDTYWRAWNSIPPHRPGVLSTYLGKITRQISIDVFRKKSSKKRQGCQYTLSLSELEECVPGGGLPEDEAELQTLADSISAYLLTLSAEAQNIFVCRYYFLDSIRDIAARRNASESKIKSTLHRTRINLKRHLEKEGYSI